jgi:hypothetical protein
VTLLICPVRPGDSNEELRFALRSWQTNLVPEDGLELMTVGYKPTWLEPDHHVEGNRHTSVPLAVFDNILLGSEEAMRHHNYDTIFMNDDFFCLDPTASVLPFRRNCTLEAHLAQFPVNAGLWWPKSLRLTLSFLREAGYPQPWSFETHRPLSGLPSGMFEALSRWDRGMGDTVPQWRTLYGVLNEVEAYPVGDVKLGLASDGYGTPWVSTSDQSWRRYAAGIKKRFPETSRWER